MKKIAVLDEDGTAGGDSDECGVKMVKLRFVRQVTSCSRGGLISHPPSPSLGHSGEGEGGGAFLVSYLIDR